MTTSCRCCGCRRSSASAVTLHQFRKGWKVAD
jgi:hypothetical protein